MYHTVEEMLHMIDEPNMFACFKILADNRELFQKVQGSTHNHQVWSGGYFDHVQEIMNIVMVFYKTLESIRPLPLQFSISDALLVVFLHDIEKPWAFEIGQDGEMRRIASLRTKKAQHEFRAQKLKEYGIVLSWDQENGMKYVEGEFDDYSNQKRVMGPLAALCHLADVTSARIFFNHPMEKDDPWLGAKRIRD